MKNKLEEIITALHNGETVQYRYSDGDDWQDIPEYIQLRVTPRIDYKFGDLFMLDDDLFVFAMVDYKKAALINIRNGNRFANPVTFEDYDNITSWAKITTGLHFEKVESAIICGKKY